jgi:hypothetical protein
MTPKMTNSNIKHKGCLFPKLWRGSLAFFIKVIRVSIYICFLVRAQDFIIGAIAFTFSDRTGE